MTVLPDTSVWVDYMRRGLQGRASRLDELLAAGEVVTCGPVVAELLGGAPEGTRADLWRSLDVLPWAELEREAWRRVGEVNALLRARGQVLGLTDIEVAVAALDAGAEIWSFDSDFERIAEVAPDLRLVGSA